MVWNVQTVERIILDCQQSNILSTYIIFIITYTKTNEFYFKLFIEFHKQ